MFTLEDNGFQKLVQFNLHDLIAKTFGKNVGTLVYNISKLRFSGMWYKAFVMVILMFDSICH